ncbi:hypothetical protein H0H93_008521 [Arthromyces matolae]|nr:hypothetical protein H0H93_008521 [Arthromyces matolae]
MRSKSQFIYLATCISLSILLARSTPIPHISELSYDVTVVDSLASRPSEVVTDRVDSSIIAETDVVRVLSPVAHSESLTTSISARAPETETDPKLPSEPISANGRAMKYHNVPRKLAGWKGIPPYVDLPKDSKTITQDDTNDLQTKLIDPIRQLILDAERINSPEDIKDKRIAFNKWQTTLRTKLGFASLLHEEDAMIASNSLSPSTLHPNSAHQQTGGQQPTGPGTASHQPFGNFRKLPPIPGHPELTAPGSATPLNPVFGDFRRLPEPFSPSSERPVTVPSDGDKLELEGPHGEKDKATVATGSNFESPDETSQISGSSIRTMQSHATTKPIASNPPEGSQRIEEEFIVKFNASIAKKQEEIIREYRDGNRTKSDTILELNAFLWGIPDGSEEGRKAAFREAISALDACDAHASAARERGKRVSHGFGSNVVHSKRGSPAIDDGSFEDSTKKLERLHIGQKRDRSDDSESGDGSSDEGVERGGKKRKIKREDFPWFKEEQLVAEAGRESCRKTQKLLHMYAIDPKFVRDEIQISGLASPSIPPAQWDNIIKGLPVNLDAVEAEKPA